MAAKTWIQCTPGTRRLAWTDGDKRHVIEFKNDLAQVSKTLGEKAVERFGDHIQTHSKKPGKSTQKE